LRGAAFFWLQVKCSVASAAVRTGPELGLMKPLAAAELAACLASVLAEVRARTAPECPAIPATRPGFSAPG